MKNSLLVLLCLGFLMVACDKNDDPEPEEMEDPCMDTSDTYTNSIAAIINASCAVAGCHDGQGRRADLSNFAAVNTAKATVRTRVVAKSMPPSGASPLTAAEIQKINCWVENGAPE